jgi:hypothetical protein
LSEPGGDLIRCNQCGNSVPRMSYCVRCGDPLSDEYDGETRARQRRRFAAAPDEQLNSVSLISTIFPQLPHAHMRTFRLALLLGVLLVIGLALIGAFAVGIVAGAVLVPLLMVLYLYVVDIYEDEPLSVVAATMLWGAAAGAVFAFAASSIQTPSPFAGGTSSQLLVHGIVLPVIAAALMFVGPLALLPARRFNDVLDGATFGAASGASFVAAQVVVSALPLLSGGLLPGGDPLPWSVQLVSLAVLQPVIAAGSIGAATAAVWLRYRAPVRDRDALGPLGSPVIAVVAAMGLVVAAGLARTGLALIPESIVLLAIAAVALLWLRRALHLGLIEELHELEEAPVVRCPNCGRGTPDVGFCGHCGISLMAVPRARRGDPGALTDAGEASDR